MPGKLFQASILSKSEATRYLHPVTIRHYILLHIGLVLGTIYPPSLRGQNGHAFVHHFDRKEVQGELTSWDISAPSNDRVAAANGDGLLIHTGGQWNLHQLPNQAAARSIAKMSDGRWLVGGQGYVGVAAMGSLDQCRFENRSQAIHEAMGNFEDVWKILPLPTTDPNATEEHFFLYASNFTGVLSSTGAFQLLDRGEIQRGFLWGADAVGWQRGDSLWKWSSGDISGVAVPKGVQVEAVITDAENRLMLFTHESGMLVEGEDGIWLESDSELSQYLKANRTRCLLQTAPDRWWVGTLRGGLLATSDLQSIETSYNKLNGLCNNAVMSIAQDDRGNLWVATEGGIDLVRLAWPIKKAAPSVIADQPGFASYHDWDTGQIYWGTSQGLYIEEMSGGGVKRVEGISGPIWSIQKIDKQLWVSHINGCGHFDDQQQYRPVIQDVGVWGVWTSPHEQLYAGTFLGVHALEKGPQDMWTALPALAGFAESSRFMRFDAEDTLWVSHPYKGAYRLAIHREENEMELLKAFGSEDGFPEPMDVYLRDVDGEMLFATSKGIWEWNRQADRMELASGNWVEWLDPSAGFSLIESDKRGNLWAISGSVLLRFTAKREQLNAAVEVTRAPFTDAPVIDGFEKIEFLPDGRICAPTETGFVYIDPEEMLAEEDVPVAEVVQVTHLNHPNGSKALPLQNLHLPAGSHALQIALKSPDSRWTGRLKYQWRIPGVSEEWSTPQFGQTIALNGLQPGLHEVEFRALIDPSLTGPLKSISIEIESPWYERWSVRAAFFLLMLLGFVAWYRRNKARLERIHQRETAKQQAEIQKVEGRLAEERLQFAQSQVQSKDAELASVTMNLVQKSQLVQTVQTSLKKLKSDLTPGQRKEIDGLLHLIQEGGKLDDAWEQFAQQFDQVHIDFHQRLTERFPDLTKNDVKLCSYLRMGLSTKEIASLMFVTVRAVEVSRSRLRKRLNLPPDVKLTVFIQNL